MRQVVAVPPYKVSMMSKTVPEGATLDESVRLAMKFNMVHWPFDNNIAAKILQDTGYTTIEQQQEYVKATRANGEFLMNRPRQVITFDGFPLNVVVSAKKNFTESLERNTGVVLDNYVVHYESIYVSIYRAKKSMNSVLANVYNDSNHMTSIRNIVGKDVRPFSIDMSSRGSHHDKSWFRIRVEPKIEGTDKTYFCMAEYRDTAIDSVIGDVESAPEIVKSLLCMLESETGKDETDLT